MLAYSQDPSDDAHFVTTTLMTLAPQLDLLSLDFEFAQSIDPTLLKHLDPITLWDMNFDVTRQEPVIPVSYIRVVPYSSIDQVIELLASTPRLRPTLLYLAPEVFNRKVTLEHRHELMTDLKTVWGDLGMEIIYEDQGKEWCLDGGLSEDFERRMETKRVGKGTVK
ncbi:uncharacterized protein JCM6883_001522 [Sporobolomyces salmoneus]|uniref:uncharacterized protein n=1 Tax=Sporobolomyces salmoneus TaxID=183962 RepID=UPI0031773E17